MAFFKIAWLINFFRWGGILAFMNCSMIAGAATPNASFESFWSLSGKTINFWFAGSKTSRWSLCFAVAIDGVSRFFYGTQSEFLPNSLCWGWWCFWRFVVHHHAWKSGSSLFYFLLSVGCDFWNLFGIDLQTVQIFLIFRQMWTLLLWGIWAILRFCWCCCWKRLK